MKRTVMSVLVGTCLAASAALAQDGGRDGLAQRLPWSDAPRGDAETPSPAAPSRPTGPGTEYSAILGYVDARLRACRDVLRSSDGAERLVTPPVTPPEDGVKARLHRALEALQATADRYGKATPEATAEQVLARLGEAEALASELQLVLGAASGEAGMNRVLHSRLVVVESLLDERARTGPGGTQVVREHLHGALYHLARLEVLEARACHERAEEALARWEDLGRPAAALEPAPAPDGLRFTGRYTPDGRMIFRAPDGSHHVRSEGRYTRLGR